MQWGKTFLTGQFIKHLASVSDVHTFSFARYEQVVQVGDDLHRVEVGVLQHRPK